MSISKRNKEGYLDLTAYQALTNIVREEKKKNKALKKSKQVQPKGKGNIVFICSPFAGDIVTNTISAQKYGKFAVKEEAIPVIPHLMYPQFLDENNIDERQLGIKMGLVLMSKCSELWVFGNYLSSGMTLEVQKAKMMKLPVRYFTTECVEKRGLAEVEECFAYNRGSCEILSVKRCQGNRCSFLKTAAEAEKEKERVVERIQNLDYYLREHLIDKYFGGNINSRDTREDL